MRKAVILRPDEIEVVVTTLGVLEDLLRELENVFGSPDLGKASVTVKALKELLDERSK